jgi:predicted O-methyltransferase YrrM
LSEPLISDRVKDYLDRLVPERPPEMQKMEVYAKKHHFPIIGPTAGYACYLIARIASAKNIFELGSGYGYSTAWFAKAVVENGGGVVNHVVWDEDLSSMARQHLDILGYGDVIRYTVGEAVQALRESDGGFDLIFNDIDKRAYPESLNVIEKKLLPGGVLIVDNALFGGRIFDLENKDEASSAILEMTSRLTDSDSWATSLLPIRDGLLVAQKQMSSSKT